MLRREYYNNKNIIINNKSITLINGDKVTTKEWDFDLKTIRHQLHQIGFHKPYNPNTYDLYYSDKLEHYGLPYMNYIYYHCIFEKLKIPTLSEFINKYIDTYCNVLDNGMIEVKPELNDEHIQFTKEQLIGRVFRSYNSFHREVDLFFQFKEHNIDVEYNLQKDLNGIDLVITYNGKEFCIASYVATENSYAWKNIKNDIRHDYKDKNMIDIIAKMKQPNCNCYNLNGIFVYDKYFIDREIEKIKRRT